MEKTDIAVVGMAVMGKNLALNLADHGFNVTVYNRTTEVAEQALADHPDAHLTLAKTPEEMVEQLQTPRKILLMVKAGRPVDAVIDQLAPLLEPGDIIIDGGNSFFKDTQRRYEALKERNLGYVGMGVSGGETGARRGPALMPGTDRETYEHIRPFLDAIAAKAPTDGKPCSAYLGEGGAGHYVKMVHNGIEYADMQLIAEVYDVLRRGGGLTTSELAGTFTRWNGGLLDSYLIEITSNLLRVLDPEKAEGTAKASAEGAALLDSILDVARQKGTGKWTNQEAIDLGVDVSVLAAGLNARFMSMFKDQREKAHTEFADLADGEEFVLDRDDLVETAEGALLAAKVLAYAQGFSLYRAASAEYGWNLDYATIASSFRAGCIIRSTLLNPMMEAFERDADLPNMVFDPYFAKIIRENMPKLRKLVISAQHAGISVPALSAALAYFDAFTTAESAANMIQAQRDYFGAHTYERTDRDGHFHAQWELAIADAEKSGKAPVAKEVRTDA